MGGALPNCACNTYSLTIVYIYGRPPGGPRTVQNVNKKRTGEQKKNESGTNLDFIFFNM
jgi:hypothetical protein